MKIKKILTTTLVIIVIIFLSRFINSYATDFMADKQEKENGIIIGAEPYSIQEDPETTVLLIHGFTSSPKDFKEMSYYLSSKGISIKAILLPGHGTTPKELENVKYEEWTSYVKKEINNIKSKNKFVLGYSLGGTLTLDLAEDENLNGIIVINPPIYLKSRFIKFIPFVKLVEKYHNKKTDAIIVAINENRIVYDATPLSSIEEIIKLISQLKLERITEPTLIIQSRNDTIVDPISADFIYSTISSEEKELIWLEKSSHTDPDNLEQKEVFEIIYRFIDENKIKH